MPDLSATRQKLLETLEPNSLAKTKRIITTQAGLSCITKEFVEPLSSNQAYYLALALRQEHTGVKLLSNKPEITDILLEKDHPYMANIIVETLKHTQTGRERLKSPQFKVKIDEAKQSYNSITEQTIGDLQKTIDQHKAANKVLGKIRRKYDGAKDESEYTPTTIVGKIGRRIPTEKGQKSAETQLSR